jgi:hypothetical protein
MRFPLTAVAGFLMLGGAAAQPVAPAAVPPPDSPFVAHMIATDVGGGYQVIAADINHDGKTDVVGLSQRGDLVWYENPTWTPHIILAESQAQGMIGQDAWHMVNADAADIDGDGYPEIALAYGFNANGPSSVGNIGILHQDGKSGWTLKEIGRVPTAHRVRFGDIDGKGRQEVFVAPVLNETETGGLALPGHVPVALWMFRPDPAQPNGWKQSLITRENMGLVHAVQPLDWDGDGQDEVLTAGFSGVFVHHLEKDGSWTRWQIAVGDTAPWPGSGSSEVQVGKIGDAQLFVTVEHFHGAMVVVYVQDGKGGYQRQVIDNALLGGHALALADFDGDGKPEIVAAGNGSRANLFYYKATDATGRNWARTLIDNDMSPSSCVAADMNGDGRPDLVCMDGRKPNYIKWYGYSR